MARHATSLTACFAVLACGLLAGCATRAPVLTDRGATELTATPFFPQSRYQCGPAALATVLAASGAAVTAEQLVPEVYLPGRRGSLQVEMKAAPRAHGRLALTLPRQLRAIVHELEAGRPVLVLHNYGLPFWPRWHYAVVVGYDPVRDRFVLRSGRKPRQLMRARHFMVFWQNAGRWAMVVLRPGETAADADARSYLEAAADLEAVAPPAQAHAAFDAAVRRWPDEPVAYVGRGTAAYRLGDLRAAAGDYAAALERDGSLLAARNNLAQTLLDLGCPTAARARLAGLDLDTVPASWRAALADTLRQAERAADAADAADCPSP